VYQWAIITSLRILTKKKVRRIYAAYIKKQIEEHPDSIVLVFPYYDNTNAVREELTSEGLNTVELEMSGALVIVDITKIVKSQYFQVPEVERLSEFIKLVEDKNKNKTVFVVADMSVFHHLKKSKELLEYEKNYTKIWLSLKIERNSAYIM
jgi:MEDS: MEthanogen/methylotroph, DcmR Sensory domain